MKIKNAILKDVIEAYKILSVKDVELAEKQAETANTTLLSSLIQNKYTTEVDILKAYGKYLKTPFIDLENKTIEKKYLEKLSEKIAQKYRAVVFDKSGDKYRVAIEDPSDFQIIQFIEKDLDHKVDFYITTTRGISNALDQYKGELSSEVSKVIKEESKTEEIKIGEGKEKSAAELKEIIQEAPIAKAINIILEYAIKTRASDIHIEPREDHVHIRYRIDGVLRDTMSLPKQVLATLTSRIKIMSNLRIDEHRIPQDGRIKLSVGSKNIAIRVSTLPVMDGEKVVMRILDESTKASTLEELGFRGNALEQIKRALKKPHGLALVTGPTGSGKSTTLYSVLSSLNTIGVNISTVEDPVEYRIQGVNQTQVSTKVGMTFAAGLRALLRQDPDVIMVGEIRDDETAEIAVHAALTGHIVLSTLHTNNAAGTLPRLLDMSIEPFLIASTVNVVIAQRLVRKVCPHCVEKYYPSEEMVKELKKEFNLDNSFLSSSKVEEKHENKSFSERQIVRPSEGAKKIEEKEAPAEKKNSLNLVLYRGKGCPKCENSGYLGRMGIFEVLEVNDEIGDLIIKRVSAEEIEETAIKRGMLTMHQDGFIKATEGLTTIEEIVRVTRE